MEKINEFISIYKLPLALSLLGIVLIVGGLTSSGILDTPHGTYSQKSVVQKEDSQIKIDIAGAVNSPGVYSLRVNSRIEDIIKAAGGFSTQANSEFIAKSLNLSQRLTDGQKVYIPFDEESSFSVAGATSNLIGLNTATASELESLPGVGPATASKIISSRPYNDLNELLSKKVVSRSVFEKIKGLIDLH